jgi:hypothetical protein
MFDRVRNWLVIYVGISVIGCVYVWKMLNFVTALMAQWERWFQVEESSYARSLFIYLNCIHEPRVH